MARTENTNTSDEKRNGPSVFTLTISGIISLGTVVASGVTSWNAIQNDLATLKRGEVYQERVNEQLREEIKSLKVDVKEVRAEQHSSMKEFGEKVDVLVEAWSFRRRKQ